MDFMDRTHISSFTREHWLQLADELGFEQRLVLNATWFGPTRADFARSLAPILIVALYRQRAGQASSLLGFLQMGMAGTGAGIAGALPMAPVGALGLVMTVAMAAASLAFGLRGHRAMETPAPAA